MKTVRTWCIRILMILFTIIFLYPLFWNLMSAFKTNAEYLTDPYALPVSLNLDNFVAAWQKANIAAYFGNSVFVTVLSTALLLLFVIPISYVLARYRFAGSKLISTIYMACIFLQATYIMIPLFLELQAINGLNNLPVLCLVYAVMQFPFCIFTLQGFMSAVPKDFEESARIDGATNLQLLLKVMVPLAKPGIATITMLSAMGFWNEYPLALVDRLGRTVCGTCDHYDSNHDHLSDRAEISAAGNRCRRIERVNWIFLKKEKRYADRSGID